MNGSDDILLFDSFVFTLVYYASIRRYECYVLFRYNIVHPLGVLSVDLLLVTIGCFVLLRIAAEPVGLYQVQRLSDLSPSPYGHGHLDLVGTR